MEDFIAKLLSQIRMPVPRASDSIQVPRVPGGMNLPQVDLQALIRMLQSGHRGGPFHGVDGRMPEQYPSRLRQSFPAGGVRG